MLQSETKSECMYEKKRQNRCLLPVKPVTPIHKIYLALRLSQIHDRNTKWKHTRNVKLA